MRLARLGLEVAAALALTTIVAPAFGEQLEEREHREIIITGGEGHLGVGLAEIDAKAAERLKLKEERGALVRHVQEDSPAARAGLKVDDAIVSYQNEPIEGVMELTRRVRETPPGRTVSIEVLRQGVRQKLSVTLDERRVGPWHLPLPQVDLPEVDVPHLEMPDLDGPWAAEGHCPWCKRVMRTGPRKLGIEFQEISGQLAEYFKVKGERGLLVVSVDADGPAAKAGVKAGDLLMRVGTEDVATARALRQIVAKAAAGEELSVTVQREGRPLELKVVVDGPKPEPDRTPVRPRKHQRT
jgi:serine protease Do